MRDQCAPGRRPYASTSSGRSGSCTGAHRSSEVQGDGLGQRSGMSPETDIRDESGGCEESPGDSQTVD
jgi:hypothetical protein